MVDLTNFFFIDGIDLWSNYKMFFEKGGTDLLRYPPKKASTEHDWLDEDGLDVDLDRYFFAARDTSFKCAIIAESEEEFFTKRDAFIYMLTRPGIRRLSITSHGARSYFVYYKDCTNAEKVKGVKGLSTPHMVAYYFTLLLSEPRPQLNTADIPLVDDSGNCILT